MKPTLALLISSAAAPAFAEDFQLRPPLNCGPATNTPCIIQQYVDSDPSAGVSDFTCGTLSYDGHKGTDFRVASLADMQLGVPVLAAAAGQIKATRDGMPDINSKAPTAPDVTGKECGNGVVIAHPSGWETQYCHLKQGSITVAQGDFVEAGEPLGLIGLSGRTEFPHVHLSVRKDGFIVDPFNADDTPNCGGPLADLWDNANTPAYQAGALLSAGFHDAIPEFSAIKAGSLTAQTLPKTAPALVIWAYMFGSQPEDSIAFEIEGAGDWSFKNTITLEQAQAQLFRATGKRRPEAGWPLGRYAGTVTLLRDGAEISQKTVSLTITQ